MATNTLTQNSVGRNSMADPSLNQQIIEEYVDSRPIGLEECDCPVSCAHLHNP